MKHLVLTLAILALPAIAADAPKKPTYKEAKAECLKTEPALKGHALRKCIHEKRSLASKK